MKMIYGVKDKPKFPSILVFAFQQLLAIMAATIAVPMIVNQNTGSEMSTSAALFGAGVGTIIYVLFTRAKSPVFLGSSFAFLGSMMTAFAGAATASLGYFALIIGAAMAGLVFVVLAVIVKFVGVKWISKIMPAVVIGPTVAIIGLSLAGNAIGDLGATDGNFAAAESPTALYVRIICGLVTLAVTMLCSVYGKKMGKLIPFIIGILAGYATASCFYVVAEIANNPELKVIDYTALTSLFTEIKPESFVSVPDFTFLKAFGDFGQFDLSYLGTVAVAYIPVAFVVFAEHIADHKNLSSIIEQDGVGSMAGAFFGGCPNTTYGESVGCVAITKNASVATIIVTAVEAMVISFITPFVAFLSTIPSCVMGGVCVALYGFIAVSGLKMLQKVDLDDNRNLFTASVILIAGVGGMVLEFGDVKITEVACALILGILTNVMLGRKKADK